MNVHTLGHRLRSDAAVYEMVDARLVAIRRLSDDLDRLDTGLLYEQVFAELARIDPAVLFERVFANLSRLRGAQLSSRAYSTLRISDGWPIMDWTMANLSRLETARLYGQVSVTLSKVANGFQAAGSYMVLLREGLVELGWFLNERAGDPAAEAVASDLARLTGSLPPASTYPVDLHATWDPWFRTGLFVAAAMLVAAQGAEEPVGAGGSVRASRMVDTAAGLVSLVLAYDAFRDLTARPGHSRVS
jgi:hypothetical protein